MSRPIKIQSYGWGTGTNLFEKFNPWQDFFENPRVLNRIANFNLLRCKLCVKFVLNGNGFHYGRAIASYIPLHTDDTFTVDRAFFIEDVVAASQRPHVYLDPTKSTGGTICLPFVWPFNALDIPDQDWREMGSMVIHGMQNLKHANGASDSVTVSVFAWAEDVELAVPTAAEPSSLEAQFGEYLPQADEYGQGIISRPANMVAKAAGALAKIPTIAPYAKATQMVASGLSTMAKAFGYSRPVDAEPIRQFKPTYVGNMANTNAVDTSTKLTLDLKQELSCDTRTFGLDGTDEMAITSIATRESFLTNFGWAVSDTAEDLLWNSYVNPVIYSELTTGSNTEYHMPACCFAALPFKYWRGTMKFRFQIVASAFHKGRLKITYDPYYAATNEYNTNFTRIVDLAEERDFTVEIGWGQQQAFLRHLPMINGTGEIFGTVPATTDRGDTANGVLSVFVVNELTVPNSTADNDIEVNVFVSMGDDFEVAVPDGRELELLSWFAPQSGEYEPQSGEMPDSDNTKEENAPMAMESEETMAATDLPITDNTYSIYIGDPVTSIRQILKRYVFFSALVPNNTPTGEVVHTKYSRNLLPLFRGYAPGAVDEAATPADPTPYNFCQLTFFNYFSPAYVCWRGGMRWKYMMLNDNTVFRNYLAVTNDVSTDEAHTQSQTAMPSTSTTTSVRKRYLRNTFPFIADGGHVVPPAVNPVVEAEFPYYWNKRFSFAKQANVNVNPGTDAAYHDVHAVCRVRSNEANYQLLAYHSVGEDFTLGFFTGAPIAYYQPDPDASTGT